MVNVLDRRIQVWHGLDRFHRGRYCRHWMPPLVAFWDVLSRCRCCASWASFFCGLFFFPTLPSLSSSTKRCLRNSFIATEVCFVFPAFLVSLPTQFFVVLLTLQAWKIWSKDYSHCLWPNWCSTAELCLPFTLWSNWRVAEFYHQIDKRVQLIRCDSTRSIGVKTCSIITCGLQQMQKLPLENRCLLQMHSRVWIAASLSQDPPRIQQRKRDWARLVEWYGCGRCRANLLNSM